MILTGDYQFIGRSNEVKSYNGLVSYYILLYAKTSGSTSTGKHTVSVKMRIASPHDTSFYNWNTTGSASVAGVSAFSWNTQPIPNAEWSRNAITEGGVTYRSWIDLKEGSAEVNVGYGVTKDVTVKSYWKRLDVSNPTGYLASVTPAEASISVTLPAIAGSSIPTLSASTIEMGKSVTIYTNPLSNGFTHRLTYVFGSASGVIAENAKSSAPWTPPVDLAVQIPSATVGVGSVYCTTYQNGVQIGSTTSVGFTLTVPNNANTQPSVSMSLSPVSALPAPFNALYIQNLTKVDADLSATGKYGASIKSYQMVVSGSKYGAPYTSGYLTQTGNVAVTGKATDSRGYAGSTEQTISVIPYAKPTVVPADGQTDIVCARCDEDGNFTDSGTYLRIIAKRNYSPITSGGVQHNFCQVRYRCNGGSWLTILADDASGDEVDTGAISNVVSSTTSSYTIEIGVVDTIGNTASVTKVVPTEQVDFHLREGGNGAAFGVYAEEEKVFIVAGDWASRFKGTAYFHSDMYRVAEDGEKEWLFPPMEVGVEYRTAARYKGKPVYTQLVDFGALPNATAKTVDCASFAELVDYRGIATTTYVCSNFFAESWMKNFYVSKSGKIHVTTTTDVTSYIANVQIWYIKEE